MSAHGWSHWRVILEPSPDDVDSFPAMVRVDERTRPMAGTRLTSELRACRGGKIIARARGLSDNIGSRADCYEGRLQAREQAWRVLVLALLKTSYPEVAPMTDEDWSDGFRDPVLTE